MFSLIFSSCSMFNVGVKDYLREYTENAAVELYKFDAEYPKDNSGITCISSDSQKQITFYMRNPQEYKLSISHSFNDAVSQTVKSEVATWGSIAQDDSDTSVFYVKFHPDLLERLECGGDITSKYLLIEPKSQRTFEPYVLPLKVNSAPQAVRNLTMLQDTGTGCYVIAFNMPDTSGIHRDIVKLTINDQDFEVTPDGSPDSTALNASVFGTTFENSFMPAMANGAEFSGTDSQRAVYYKTDIRMQETEYPFTVTLTDQAGLSSISRISANSKRLDDVTFSVENFDGLEQDTDGYIHFSVTAPASNADSTVYYNVYNNAGKLVKQGANAGKVDVQLSVGKWRVEAWAHKNGYMDSNARNIQGTVQGFVYVNPLYDGNVEDGGKQTPYKSLSNAIKTASPFAVDVLKIYLMADAAVTEKIDVSVVSLEIVGNGNKITGTSGSVLFDVAESKNLSLMNTDKVTGNIVINKNGTLKIGGGTVLERVALGDGAKIKLNKLTGTNKVATIVYNSPAQDVVILESDTADLLTASETGRFELNNPGFFLDIENGKGLIKTAGAGITQYENSKVGFIISGITANNQDNPENAYYTVNKGDVITVSVKNENGIDISSTLSVTMTLKTWDQDETEYLEKSTSKVLTVPADYLGTTIPRGTVCNLIIECTYAGKPYKSVIPVLYAD